MAETIHESFNDRRLDEIARPLFDRAMNLALKMLDAPTINLDRLHALAHLADAVAGGFDEHNTRDDEARDDLCRRVFGAGALKAKAILDGSVQGGSESIEALAELMDAAACGFKDDDETEEQDAYDHSGGMM